MDKRLMHYQFPAERLQLEGTVVNLQMKVAAIVEDSTDEAIVNAVLEAARANDVTDLYLLDKTFILDAIREKKERENPKPLTIVELRQMNRQPVYVVPQDEFHDRKYWEEWCVLDSDEAIPPGIEYWSWALEDYGKTWTAYRHKPKPAPATMPYPSNPHPNCRCSITYDESIHSTPAEDKKHSGLIEED